MCMYAKQDLQIIKQPQSNILCEYRTKVVLSVSSVGFGHLSFEWMKDGNVMTDSAAAEFTGINTDTLTISSFLSSHQGNYQCAIKNNHKSVKSSPTNVTLSKWHSVFSNSVLSIFL